MISDMVALDHKVTGLLDAAQTYIQEYRRAVKQKDKVAFKKSRQTLKDEVEQLSSILKPLLQQVNSKDMN